MNTNNMMPPNIGMNNNQMNIPNIVNNIEQNIDTFGNMNSQNYVPIEQAVDNRVQHQNMTYNPNIPPQQYNMNQQQMSNNMPQQIPMQHNQYIPQNNQIVNTIEHLDTPKPGFIKRNLSLIKPLLIYTILFIIFTHSMMTEIICSKLPCLDNIESNIPCIAFKGFLMGIVIILFTKFSIL